MEKLNALCLLICLISLTTGFSIIGHHVYNVNESSSLLWLIAKAGIFVKRKLDGETANFRATQERLLLKILGTNGDTEYGRLNRFSQIKNREIFRREHPLTKYRHYEAYVNRMVDGETGVLSNCPLRMFAMSSGTTGKAKRLPIVKEGNYSFLLYVSILPLYVAFQKWPGLTQLIKLMRMICAPHKRLYSKTGLFMGAFSAHPDSMKAAMFLCTDPNEVTDVIGEPQTLYLHLLFALRDRYLGMMSGSFASVVFHVTQILETEWQHLANDIEKGTIKSDLDIDVNVRQRLQMKLSPEPKRAEEIRRECQQGFEGIVKRLWPTVSLIMSLNSGSQEIYFRNLKEHACKGVSFYSTVYMASEGFFGVNLNPTDESNQDYVLVASCVFFEFIKVEDSHEDQPPTVFAEQVEIGKEYEVAVTTWSGLCRYRYGDVVRICDFYNQAPVVQFSYRIGQMLNVCSEKTSEKTFSRALKKAESRWRHCRVIDYCCAESILMRDAVTDFTEEAPHYVVFLELDDHSGQLSQEEKNYIDEELCASSYVYESFRRKGSIGPMRVLIVREQSFQDLKSRVITTTTTVAAQYKVPRVLNNVEHLKLLLDRVLG